MNAQDRKTVRRAGAEDTRTSRLAAGLPERIEDVTTAAQLAGLLRAPSQSTSEVTLSGRCGTCGYLLDSAGHKISCG